MACALDHFLDWRDIMMPSPSIIFTLTGGIMMPRPSIIFSLTGGTMMSRHSIIFSSTGRVMIPRHSIIFSSAGGAMMPQAQHNPSSSSLAFGYRELLGEILAMMGAFHPGPQRVGHSICYTRFQQRRHLKDQNYQNTRPIPTLDSGYQRFWQRQVGILCRKHGMRRYQHSIAAAIDETLLRIPNVGRECW